MLDDTYYRGQTKNGKLLTRFVMSSFTDSHDIATIYASNEGRDFGNDANVVTARLRITNPLDLSQYGPISTFVVELELAHGIGKVFIASDATAARTVDKNEAGGHATVHGDE